MRSAKITQLSQISKVNLKPTVNQEPTFVRRFWGFAHEDGLPYRLGNRTQLADIMFNQLHEYGISSSKSSAQGDNRFMLYRMSAVEAFNAAKSIASATRLVLPTKFVLSYYSVQKRRCAIQLHEEPRPCMENGKMAIVSR